MFASLIRLILILLFRTFLWGLVTANFTETNLLGGLVLSAIIPMGNYKNLKMEVVKNILIYIIKYIYQNNSFNGVLKQRMPFEKRIWR